MKYKSVLVTRFGGPEVLQVVENDLHSPAATEVRIKVLAAAVCRPDVTVRRGEALYTGTPLGKKPPFVPGYAIIGEVDAIGVKVRGVAIGERVGVLTVTGGYAEYLYWRSDRLIPVPNELDPAEAVTLVLNYIVAYQSLHRSAKVKPGEITLIIGASGGIGTALMQLGNLADLRMYGLASKCKHDLLIQFGVTPIDYQTQDFVEVIRQLEPEGLEVVIDGMTRMETLRKALALLRGGGRLVSFGEPTGFSDLLRVMGTFAKVNLLPNGKSCKFYGTSFYFVGDRQPFLEDWARLFQLLEEGKIQPVIERKFPILEAAQANELLESGQVSGNVVLVAPELLSD
jgi:NADPH:quinone reductase-like Zn-dependent oxidoreductase